MCFDREPPLIGRTYQVAFGSLIGTEAHKVQCSLTCDRNNQIELDLGAKGFVAKSAAANNIPLVWMIHSCEQFEP